MKKYLLGLFERWKRLDKFSKCRVLCLSLVPLLFVVIQIDSFLTTRAVHRDVENFRETIRAMPVIPEDDLQQWQRFLSSISTELRYAHQAQEAEKQFYLALLRLRKGCIWQDVRKPTSEEKVACEKSSAAIGQLELKTIEGLSECMQNLPQWDLCKRFSQMPSHAKTYYKILEQLDALQNQVNDGERKLADIKEELKKGLQLTGYIVGQIEPQKYEISFMDGTNRRVVLITKTQTFQSKGWFTLWVTRSGSIPVKISAEAGGFDAEWKVFVEDTNRKDLLEAQKTLQKSLKSLNAAMGSSLQIPEIESVKQAGQQFTDELFTTAKSYEKHAAL